ncbi:hypothetical protein SLA2020_093700 [Shorea laevis]
MASHLHSFFPSLPFIILALVLAFVPALVHTLTLESDIETLRALIQSLDPNSFPSTCYLKTWDFNTDPCETSVGFLGILCSVTANTSASRIIAIELDGVGYEGYLTPAIGNLTELTALDLSNNRFRGPLPNTIANLKKLSKLNMSGNYFTGRIPSDITNIKTLELIDLSTNHLSGSIPADLSVIRRLLYVSLSNNQFSGRIPNLSGLWRLHTLMLDHNMLYGNIPQLPISLRTLSLANNLISGHITPVKRLTELRILDLNNNRLSGEIKEEILTLPQVNRINVSFNEFTVISVNASNGRVSQLRELDAQGNLLHGHLPVRLVTYENLRAINLAQNRFTGSIPMEYGAKLGRPWRRLFLDNNFLTGSIPQEFYKVKIRGSLAMNCLKCPTSIELCHGGQQPASDCAAANNSQ